MSDSKENGIFVWDENSETLPTLGEAFVYKNGKYIAFTLDEMPVVVDMEKGRFDLEMTIRIFGGHMNAPVFDVLIKSGVISKEDLIQGLGNKTKIDSRYLEGLFDKFGTLVEEIGEDNVEQFLADKGITVPEMAKFMDTWEHIKISNGMGRMIMSLLDPSNILASTPGKNSRPL